MTYPGRVILIRHGQTSWAAAGKHTGHTDIELTDQGRDEAAAARRTLESLSFDAVYSSPLSRAFETATIVGLDNAIVTEQLLMEWDYGESEGKTTGEMRTTIDGWSVWTHPATVAETVEAVGDRVDAFIDGALASVDSTEGNVAVFAHGHLLAIFIARWLGLAAIEGRRFKLETATVSLLDHHREDRVIRALNHRCGDRLHLGAS